MMKKQKKELAVITHEEIKTANITTHEIKEPRLKRYLEKYKHLYKRK
ncbi:hypothetical protein MWG07_11930 [Fusobacterium necrophorum]|uniref:Uncharacterized protein n=1 Tax=Fusobacterium necrophorum TaxID=859 RepID=A0AAW6WDT3_9FUSO|nr:hypothetical protein [Fusobacterium necrophorum]